MARRDLVASVAVVAVCLGALVLGEVVSTAMLGAAAFAQTETYALNASAGPGGSIKESEVHFLVPTFGEGDFFEPIEAFAEVLNRAGYASPVRTPRGRDIMAACGQLKSESQKLRAKERLALDAGA